MAEYMTTREVAAYLRLNEKKVYALVKEGKLPAARVSGKWLFPRHVIDAWVDESTTYPSKGRMASLVDDVAIVQGSDDLLLSSALATLRPHLDLSIVSAPVGSFGGLDALENGTAHICPLHLERAAIDQRPGRAEDLYLVELFERRQGLVVTPGRRHLVEDLRAVAQLGLRVALRQPTSGTYALTKRLFEAHGVAPETLQTVGPFATHAEVVLAIRAGEADVGVAIEAAAARFGVDFVPLDTERFSLAIPAVFMGHPNIARLLEGLQARLSATKAPLGYDTSRTGALTVVPAGRGDSVFRANGTSKH